MLPSRGTSMRDKEVRGSGFSSPSSKAGYPIDLRNEKEGLIGAPGCWHDVSKLQIAVMVLAIAGPIFGGLIGGVIGRIQCGSTRGVCHRSTRRCT